jgi:hypothetical protein
MFLDQLPTAVKKCCWPELLEIILQKVGCVVVPMKMYPVPEKCPTGRLGNFGRTSTIDGRLYREAFGGITLRFASHEENYMLEGFSQLNI